MESFMEDGTELQKITERSEDIGQRTCSFASDPKLERSDDEGRLLAEKIKQIHVKEAKKYDMVSSLLDRKILQEHISGCEEKKWLKMLLEKVQSDLDLEKNNIKSLLDRTFLIKQQCDWESEILLKELEEIVRNIRQYEDYIADNCYNFLNPTWVFLKNAGHEELQQRKEILQQQKIEVKDRIISCWESIKAYDEILSCLNRERIHRKQRQAELASNLEFSGHFRNTLYKIHLQRLSKEKEEIQIKKGALQSEILIRSNVEPEKNRKCILEVQKLGCTFDFFLKHKVNSGRNITAYNDLVDMFKKKLVSLETPRNTQLDTNRMLIKYLENYESQLSQEEATYLELKRAAEKMKRHLLVGASPSFNKNNYMNDKFSDVSTNGGHTSTLSTDQQKRCQTVNNCATSVVVQQQHLEARKQNINVAHTQRSIPDSTVRNLSLDDAKLFHNIDPSETSKASHVIVGLGEHPQNDCSKEIKKLFSVQQPSSNISTFREKSIVLDRNMKQCTPVASVPASSALSVQGKMQRSELVSHATEDSVGIELKKNQPLSLKSLCLLRGESKELPSRTAIGKGYDKPTLISKSSIKKKLELGMSQEGKKRIDGILQQDKKEMESNKLRSKEQIVQKIQKQTGAESENSQNVIFMDKRDILLTKLQKKTDLINVNVQNTHSELLEMKEKYKQMETAVERVLNILEKNGGLNTNK